MKVYFDEFETLIDDPAYTPPPGSYVYSTRRGDFVFPAEGRLLAVTSEEPAPADYPPEK